MLVVFDFDKTLTYKDTLLGFFYICAREDATIVLKLPLYALSMLAHKLKLISNENLKRIGVTLFLRGKSKGFITKRAKLYSQSIKLNNVYHSEFKKYEHPYLVSASFSEYLCPLFPETIIFCSEIEYNDNEAKCLKSNCHGKEKYLRLRDNGIDHIDKLYTDSISDLPLAQISDEIYLVEGDKITKCNDLQHFIDLAS